MTDNHNFLSKLNESSEVFKRLLHISYQHLPRELVTEREFVKLYHYQPIQLNPNVQPVLIVFATINRPEILELTQENSFIGGLLKQGIDLYLLDWGYPAKEDNEISISDYVTDYLDHCVKFILNETKQKKINLLGICQGGTICICYATLNSNIKNLILISTPIDFHTKDNIIANVMKHINVDTLTRHNQNISGLWLTQFFISLRPFELIGKKYLRFVNHLSNQVLTDRFLRVEKWLYDAPDQTGTSFSELMKDFYQANKLIKGEIFLYGRKVDLTKLTLPILNIMGKHDEIVPISATRALKNIVSTKLYSERIFESGHIGIYISDKVGQRMPQAIAKWLKQNT